MACIYAALILVDDDVAVTGDKIASLLKTAKIEVEPFWPGLFAKALEGVNPKEFITNLSQGVGSAGAAAAPAAAAATKGGDAPKAAAEEKKKKEPEPEPEEEEDMGFGLFD